MLGGTVAVPVLLLKVTITPPGPAGETSVTVPVDVAPPVTGFGMKLMPPSTPWPGPPGLIVRVPLPVFDEVAVIVAAVVVVTGLVFTGKVPVVCPEGIVMLPGTVADPVLLLRVTITPLGPAGLDIVTVPIDGDPPVTGLGLNVTPVIVP